MLYLENIQYAVLSLVYLMKLSHQNLTRATKEERAS